LKWCKLRNQTTTKAAPRTHSTTRRARCSPHRAQPCSKTHQFTSRRRRKLKTKLLTLKFLVRLLTATRTVAITQSRIRHSPQPLSHKINHGLQLCRPCHKVPWMIIQFQCRHPKKNLIRKRFTLCLKRRHLNANAKNRFMIT